MTTDVTDLVMTKYFIGEKQREVLRLTKEIVELRLKLYKKCTHPTTIEIKECNSGGYDHRSFILIKDTCTICDKIIKEYLDPNHVGQYA